MPLRQPDNQPDQSDCTNPRCVDGYVQSFAAQPGYEYTACQTCRTRGDLHGLPMPFSMESPSLDEQVAEFKREYRPGGRRVA